MKRLLLGALLLLITTTAIAATPLYGSRTKIIRNWPATIPTEGTPQESDTEDISGVDITPTEDATQSEGSEQEAAEEPAGVDITPTEDTAPTEEEIKEGSDGVEEINEIPAEAEKEGPQ